MKYTAVSMLLIRTNSGCVFIVKFKIFPTKHNRMHKEIPNFLLGSVIEIFEIVLHLATKYPMLGLVVKYEINKRRNDRETAMVVDVPIVERLMREGFMECPNIIEGRTDQTRKLMKNLKEHNFR